MGQADIATARYLRRNEIFADMFNFFLYNGEEVLEPDSLQELDTREIEVPELLEIKRKYLIRYSDIAWLTSLPNCQRVEIVQTHLKSDDGGGVRVCQSGMRDDAYKNASLAKNG